MEKPYVSLSFCVNLTLISLYLKEVSMTFLTSFTESFLLHFIKVVDTTTPES